MFKLVKAVSDTVLDMTNVPCRNKPLVIIGATSRKKLIFHLGANISFYQTLLSRYQHILNFNVYLAKLMD